MTHLLLPLQCEHPHLFPLNPFMMTPLPLPLQCEHPHLFPLNPFMTTPLLLPLQCEHPHLFPLNPFMMTPLPLPLQCEHPHLIALNPFFGQRYHCRCRHSVWTNLKGFNWPLCGRYPNSLEFSLEFWWYNYNRWKQELVIQMFQINVVVIACYTPTTHFNPLDLLK